MSTSSDVQAEEEILRKEIVKKEKRNLPSTPCCCKIPPRSISGVFPMRSDGLEAILRLRVCALRRLREIVRVMEEVDISLNMA